MSSRTEPSANVCIAEGTCVILMIQGSVLFVKSTIW